MHAKPTESAGPDAGSTHNPKTPKAALERKYLHAGILQQPEDLTVTEAKATERDTVANVFPRMRSAISCPRAASRSEVTLS